MLVGERLMVVCWPNMVVIEGSGGVVGAKLCVALGLDVVEANAGIISVVILDSPVVSVFLCVTLTDDA